MTPTWRKPVGALVILAMIAGWCVLIATLSGRVGGWHWAAQAAFYLVTGVVWITPMRPLLVWMETGRFR